MTQPAVSQWERDCAFPRARTRVKLEALFGADINTLMSPAKKNGAAPIRSSAAPIPTNRREGVDRDFQSIA